MRCVNLLEVPDSGTITVNGTKVTWEENGIFKRLSNHDMKQVRKKIGMIFQHFNLLDRSTVFDNVAYPLKYSGMPKERIRERVYELLDLVDLSDKIEAYPKVAVMEKGRVVEQGDVYSIFAAPEQNITRKFIASQSSLSKIGAIASSAHRLIDTGTGSKLVRLQFEKDVVGDALISEVSRKYIGLFNRSRIKRKSANKYKRTDALTKASFSAIVPANYEHIDDKRMH